MGAMMRTRRRRPKTEEAPEDGAAEAPVAVAQRRFIINLNMLSNVDVKFYTEGVSMTDVIARWRAAIGRAKLQHPEEAVEVVMGAGEGATSYVLYLAEVTAFAVGPFVDDSDAIDYTVNV